MSPWRDHLLMLLLLAAAGIASIVFAERIPVQNGFGWDGSAYGRIALDFPHQLLDVGIDSYRLQRVLPSAVIYFALGALGLPREVPHVVVGFAFLDLVLLLITCLLWKPVADRLGVSRRGRWIGFVALFVNYATLKHAFYIPVMTDVGAFALGMTAFWLYLSDRRVWLSCAAVVGAFLWPTAGAFCVVLLLFPPGVAPLDGDRTGLASLAGAAAALGITVSFGWMYYARGIRRVGNGPTIPVVEPVLLLSVALTAMLVFLGTRELLRGLRWRWILDVLRSLRLPAVLLAAAAIALPRVLMALLPEGGPPMQDARALARFLVFLPNTRPLVSPVSHVIYYGPAVLLLLACWPRVARLVRELGAGGVAFVAAALLIALTPESRQSSFSGPVLLALAARASDEIALSRAQLVVLGVSALAFSKFWLTINVMGADIEPTTIPAWAAAYRRYYMNSGPWMDNEAYVVHLAAVVLTAALLWWLRPNGRRFSVLA